MKDSVRMKNQANQNPRQTHNVILVGNNPVED